MVLTRSLTRNNILLNIEQPDLANNSNTSISIPLSHSTPGAVLENEQTTETQNPSNINNQAFNFPTITNNNDISSLKLPTFWISCPEAWFMQAEMQFNIKHVKDDTVKFQHVIVALPQEVITKILDILQKPPTIAKYEFIKKTLCERFSLSEEKRLEQLFSDKQMGDRKPSEFYRDMSNIAGSVSMIGSDLLYKLWMRKLPQELQIHLTSSNLDKIEERLTLADKIWDVLNKNQISMISSNNTYSTNQEIFQTFSKITSQICQNLEKLNLEISELRASRPINRDEPTFRRNSRSRSRRRFNKCWYHFKYGANAHKCIPPCNFQSNNTDSNNLN